MTACIYQPSKSAMQSGTAKSRHWILKFDQTARKTLDPLMGHTSTGDMQQQINLRFGSKEEAIAYAERNKIDYRLVETKSRKRVIKSYAANFAPARVDGNWTH